MKQAIIIRDDLKMGKGKIAAQASHASTKAAIEAKEGIIEDKTLSENFKAWFLAWDNDLYKKIVLKANSEKELTDLYLQAMDHLPCFLVEDMGLTQIEPHTITALAIGPAPDEMVDTITKGLKLL